MGTNKEMAPQYSTKYDWNGGGKIWCYPFHHGNSMESKSEKTMGMQMINDPRYNLTEGQDPPSYNARLQSDMFVMALDDIHEGQEIFIDYSLNNGDSMQGSES